MKHQVKEPHLLLDFLMDAFHLSRNKAKSYLKRNQVIVDGKVISKFDYALVSGQVVEISKALKSENQLRGLSILYEDNDIVVVDKEAGLLTIATKPNDSKPTAHRQLSQYVQKTDKRARIFIVHRLDRDTSGILVFAKNDRAKHILQSEWKQRVKDRLYVARVEGYIKKQSDDIESYLVESKTHKMHVVAKTEQAIYAKLSYQVLEFINGDTLVQVSLETGRKNQIRVQMASIGHPIVGDEKYGASSNAIKRLALHAETLSFNHPITNQLLTFKVPVPQQFYK